MKMMAVQPTLATVAIETAPRTGGALVIGWGNAQRGDDGAGLAVVAEFFQRYPGVARGICCQQLTPELAADVAAARVVVLIDAGHDVPGEVRWRELHPATGLLPGGAVLGHALEPTTLLDLARAVYGRAPQAALLTIGGVDDAWREGLSPVVAAGVERAVEELRHWLTERSVEASCERPTTLP